MPLLDDHVRLDQASFMRLSEAYFAGRGVAIWRQGEVPSYATSSPPAAARVAALVAAFAAGRPVRVLEIGGGSGAFAKNFLEAYSGPLAYVWSDFSRQTVTDGVRGVLTDEVASGRLTPALFDARHPDQIVGLSGAVDAGFDVVIANYVACVLPTRVFRRRSTWEEALVRVSVAAEGDVVARAASESGLLQGFEIEVAWAPVTDLPAGVEAIGGEAPVLWPCGFFEALDGLRALVSPGAIAVISDFGIVDPDTVPTDEHVLPKRFGNSIAFSVQFPSIEAWARSTGRDFASSCDAMMAVHTAIVSFGRPLPADLAADVAAIDGLDPSQDLLDFQLIADKLREQGDYSDAARFYARCARLAPKDLLFRVNAAAACTDAGYPKQALAHLEVARRLVPGDLTTLFEAARARHRLGDWPAARRLYHRHLELGETAEAHLNLGIIAEAEDQPVIALEHYRRALELDPASNAAALIEQLG